MLSPLEVAASPLHAHSHSELVHAIVSGSLPNVPHGIGNIHASRLTLQHHDLVERHGVPARERVAGLPRAYYADLLLLGQPCCSCALGGFQSPFLRSGAITLYMIANLPDYLNMQRHNSA